MSDQEGPSGGLPPQGPTYQELINTVKTARKDLTRRERSRMDRELIKLTELSNESDYSHTSDTDTSASSKTSDSETNSEGSSRRKKKVKRRTEKRSKTGKQYRDALQNLKDIVRSQVTGETADGIYDYLEATSRVAKSSKLNKDQFFDLIKSRIAPESTLYREVANCQRKRKSVKELYHILCVLFQGNMGYPQTLKKFNDYRGENLTASQFLSKLRALANDLCYNIQDEKETVMRIEEAVSCFVRVLLNNRLIGTFEALIFQRI